MKLKILTFFLLCSSANYAFSNECMTTDKAACIKNTSCAWDKSQKKCVQQELKKESTKQNDSLEANPLDEVPLPELKDEPPGLNKQN